MSWVWDHSPVSGNERLVLLAIADNTDDNGTNAWPSLHTLARKTRIDVRTVRRVLRRLEVGGHLLVGIASGPGGANRYTVRMRRPAPEGTRTPVDEDVNNPVDEQPAPPGRNARGRNARGDGVPGTPDKPCTGDPGRDSARRTSSTSKNDPDARDAPRPGGVASPLMPGVPRCNWHPQQGAANCGTCRSERLGGTQ
ncbi:helix-turn-helix domain-containing protein [Dactylosporangium sp. NPDC005555]|uniref:helix-turn-helix domain-containing protein n=1 Tax=Dactylosporangium sp. NPDC005555 TaxID=3154889 RepID=UPI0033A7C8F6